MYAESPLREGVVGARRWAVEVGRGALVTVAVVVVAARGLEGAASRRERGGVFRRGGVRVRVGASDGENVRDGVVRRKAALGLQRVVFRSQERNMEI